VLRFSVIIPVKPGGYVKALERLSRVTYPPEKIEILVAEGRCPSSQRNRAAAEAGGDILYFLDDDSLVGHGFLGTAAAHFDDPRVAVAGGPSLTPDTDSLLQHAFGMVFISRFGGGGVRNRYRWSDGVRATGEHELILCNLSFREDVFLENGGFDERLYPNEENELMDRIAASGMLLIHDPAMSVERSQRRTVRAFARQLFGYGRGRAEQTVISGKIKPVTFIPALFLIYLVSVPFSSGGLFLLPLACYGAAALFASVREWLRKGQLRPALLLPFLFPLFHCSFGIGMLRGFIGYPFRRENALEREVTVRQIKRFVEGFPGNSESRHNSLA
jgi:succinoglycan biosynthesis protein ExoA